MITNIEFPIGSKSSDFNQLTTYTIYSATTNSASVLTENINVYSPDPYSFSISNNTNNKNCRIKYQLTNLNTEHIIEFHTKLTTAYTPTGWPVLSSTVTNGTLVEVLKSDSFADASSGRWITFKYKIIPDYNVTEIILNVSLDFSPSSLTSMTYIASGVIISYLNGVGSPVNNLIPLTITTNVPYEYSDIVFSLQNINTSEMIIDDVLSSVDSNNQAKIDLGPLLRNSINTKYVDNLVFNETIFPYINPSNNDSGIVPIKIYGKEKSIGGLITSISAVTGTLQVNFSTPIENNITLGTQIKYIYIPNITILNTDPLKVSGITTNINNEIISLKLVDINDIVVGWLGTFTSEGFIQTQGNLIERQETQFSGWTGLNIFKGSFNDYNYNNINYITNNYSNKILSTFPKNEVKPIVAGHLELFTLWQNPLNNLTNIVTPDNQIITNNNLLYYSGNSYNSNKNIQLEVGYISGYSLTGGTLRLNFVSGDSVSYMSEYLNICGNDGIITTEDILLNDDDYVKIFWLNELGGWESFYFKRLQETINTELNLYYRKNIDSSLYNGNRVYNGTIGESIRLSSGFLTRNISIWIKGLFSSGLIYMYEKFSGTHKLTPVLITDTQYTTNLKNDMMRIAVFTIERASTKRVNI
jgi:hypothetical protein